MYFARSTHLDVMTKAL